MNAQTLTTPPAATDLPCPPWCVGHIEPGDPHLSEGVTITDGGSVVIVDVEQVHGGQARVRISDNGGGHSPANAREIVGALVQQILIAEQRCGAMMGVTR